MYVKQKILKWLGLLFLLTVPSISKAQQNFVSGSISTAGADCSVSTNCVSLPLPLNLGGVAITTLGTFTGTLQFEGSVDGSNFFSLAATPLSGGAQVTTTTGTGAWIAGVSGLSNVRVRASALSSGSVNLVLKGSVASARNIGGGGGGGGTPGGSSTQLQYNNANVFGGTSNGTYTSATGVFSFSQFANSNDLLFANRFTDTSPTGNFLHFQNAAKNADLFTVDVTGTLVTGIVPFTNLSGTAGAAQLTLTTNGDIPAKIGGVLARLPQGANGTFIGVSGGVLGYFTPSGTGTVTHSIGALTANQFLCGNGGADIKLADANGCAYPMGTITTDIQPLKVTWTQNAAGVVFNGIEIVVTDTAHAAGSQILQIIGGSGATTNLFKLDTAGNLVLNGSLTTGVAGTTGSIALSGSTSGTITIQPQAIAGTYNFNLPTTAGTAGQFLTSQGGGSTAMTWTTGSGAVSSVFGRTGAVVAAANDYTLDLIGNLAASKTFANGNFLLAFNCAQTTDAQDCVTFGETSAATGGTLTSGLANQAEVAIATATNSTATPIEIAQGSITNTVATPLMQLESTWNNASLVGVGIVENVTNTASAAGSLLMSLNVGGTFQFKVDKAGVGSFATSIGTGTQPACTAGTGGALCQTEGTSATGLASTDIWDANSTQHAASVNNNNTGDMPVSRVACVSVAPVTVAANVTTDQLLMACTLSANLLNVVGRTLKVTTASIYSTPAASVSQMTEKIKLCTVSGCGSGTVVTLVSIQSSALGTITVTNNAIQLPAFITTQTAGASSTYEAHGCLDIDLNSSISGADTVFCDTNTAVSAAIDSTVQLFLQVTGAFSTASASNSWSERQLIVEVLD